MSPAHFQAYQVVAMPILRKYLYSGTVGRQEFSKICSRAVIKSKNRFLNPSISRRSIGDICARLAQQRLAKVAIR